MGSWTVHTSFPAGVYSLTQDPLISDTSRLPSASGGSPFGEPIEAGG